MPIALTVEFTASENGDDDADLLLSDLERIEMYITSEIVFQRYFCFFVNRNM